MLGVYIILAMIGNILPSALFPETSIMFGGIAVLLVVWLYGTGWGVVVALLAGLHTIAVWHHPFVAVIFIVEALTVGLVLKRGFNLILADLYFWFFVSLPLYVLFYYILIGTDIHAAGLIVSKRALNGIFNAILAMVAIRFLRLKQYHNSPQALWDNWLSIILLSFALPPILIMIFNGKPFVQLFRPSYETQLIANCRVMQDKLAGYLDKVQEAGKELAMLAGEKGLHDLRPLQDLADSLHNDLPPGMYTYITDSDDKIILSSLDKPSMTGRINPERDRCLLQDRKPTAGYSEVHTDDIMPLPHVTYSIPVPGNGDYAGAAHITLDNTVISDILRNTGSEHDVVFTIIDRQNRVFASGNNKKKPLEEFFDNDNRYDLSGINSFVWQPEESRFVPVTPFLSMIRLADPAPWTNGQAPLKLAFEMAAYINPTILHGQYLNSLMLMLTPALFALLLVWVLNKRVTGPLNNLIDVTRNLPERHSNGEKISWPQDPGWEVSELAANFQELVETLNDKEKLLKEWADEHEKIKHEAKKAVVDVRAQRNWEVFSANRKLRAEVDQGERMKALLAELEAAEKKYRFLVERSLIGVYVVRFEKLVYVNPRFAEILGYPQKELLQGIEFKVLVAKDDWLLVRANHQRLLRNEARNLQYKYRAVCKNGRVCHVEVLDGISSYDGQMAIVGTLLDITSRVKAEETIKHMAYHDHLTGLPNRLLFNDRIQQSFTLAERHQTMVGLLFLDLDRFKAVNDTLGHVAGDKLLEEVSMRLQEGLRSCDTISRFGGDEFNVLVTEVNQESDIQMVAHKIIRTMEYPFYLEDQELFVTCSIGIAIYPRDGEDADILIKKADTALYRAKDMGRNNFQIYSPAMSSQALERMAMESSLRHALERHEFRVFYQPQVDIATGRIVGFEALVRWNHPDSGIISPANFIPLAEEIGFIAPIGEWVLRTACLQAKAWQEEGYDPIRIGVNVSASQFDTPHFSEMVSDIIREAGVGPEWVNLEVTESVVVKNVDEAIAKFNELHDVGLTIAIDDFGIGYSSLSYLKDFPIDQLKMDRAFVRNLPHEKDDANIALHIVKMAQDLNMSVIAEGVENEEQLNFLRFLGCNEVQGYIVSKPVPPEEAVLFFNETLL